jgi:hypothetical protein
MGNRQIRFELVQIFLLTPSDFVVTPNYQGKLTDIINQLFSENIEPMFEEISKDDYVGFQISINC